MYLLNKYIKSVLWRVAKRLSYIDERTVPKGWKNVFLIRQGQPCGLPSFLCEYCGCFLGKKRPHRAVEHLHHLAPGLGIIWATLVLPICSYLPCYGENFAVFWLHIPNFSVIVPWSHSIFFYSTFIRWRQPNQLLRHFVFVYKPMTLLATSNMLVFFSSNVNISFHFFFLI